MSMRILIVSATSFEISFLAGNKADVKPGALFNVSFSNHSIEILITGVGMTMTAFHLGICLQKNKYDLVLNIGLAGAFNKQLHLGEVIQVTVDSFADLGAEDNESFLNVFELGFADHNQFPFKQGKLIAQHSYQQQLMELKTVEGITVNKVHGNDVSITNLLKQCNSEVETMEGAAFFYCCLYHKINCVQIRSISNYVEKRDKTKWHIPLALSQLELCVNKFLIDVP